MKYIMLLWPHANARYRDSETTLAEAELRLLLREEVRIERQTCCGLPALCVEIDAPADLFARHSLLYGLFEARPDGSMLPVIGRAPAYLGDDLPAILKYKGKTNEMFLQLLLNVAYASSDYFGSDEPLNYYDPMCGRGTSLFVAANYGWNATGSDLDKNDLHEAECYFKRYLEYHKFKHSEDRPSLTAGKTAVPVCRFAYADTAEHFKQKQTVSLRFCNADAGLARDLFGKSAFHLITSDLPYGVQHKANDGARIAPEALLKRILPKWRETLKKGGALALSFNAQTLKRDTLCGILAEAGFEVLEDGAYDAFEHWVEQSVTRDIVVARR